MIDAAAAGALSFDKLEAMTCVCSVGLDMIAVPGDTPASTIAAIITDEAAIGMINRKTTAVRLIPAPGKHVGDVVSFGGLLGRAPVIALHGESSDAFIARGGRIPAPLQALNNRQRAQPTGGIGGCARAVALIDVPPPRHGRPRIDARRSTTGSGRVALCRRSPPSGSRG
jgi:hypothetical protein